MLEKIKNITKQKAQGIVEYALLLAFVVGIAMMLNGGDLGGAVQGVFEDVSILLGGEITAAKNYPSYFKDWRTKTTEELKGISQKDRLKADREALSLIASYFLEKTVDEVHDQMGEFTKAYNNCDQWFVDNLDQSRMGPGEDGWSEIMVPLSYRGMDYDIGGYYWLESSNNSALIKEMAGAENNAQTDKWNGRSQTKDRVFYSDEMIGSGSADRAVAMRVHYDSEGKVDQVRIAAQSGVKTQTAKVENQVVNSAGYSAFSGESESLKGLDITVSGSSSDYRYKVNN